MSSPSYVYAMTSKVSDDMLGVFNTGDVRTLLYVLLAGYVTYGLLLALYRVTFHPLAGFPGYTICAMTEWYEFYCYIVKGGQWGNEVRRMHERYGKAIPSFATRSLTHVDLHISL